MVAGPYVLAGRGRGGRVLDKQLGQEHAHPCHRGIRLEPEVTNEEENHQRAHVAVLQPFRATVDCHWPWAEPGHGDEAVNHREGQATAFVDHEVLHLDVLVMEMILVVCCALIVFQAHDHRHAKLVLKEVGVELGAEEPRATTVEPKLLSRQVHWPGENKDLTWDQHAHPAILRLHVVGEGLQVQGAVVECLGLLLNLA